MRLRVLAVAAVLSASGSAAAQGSRGPFSMHGGRLIGNGESAVAGGLGWPGAFLEYEVGISSSFDLGFRGDLLYGSPTSSSGSLLDTYLGFLGTVPARLELSESRRVGIALGLRPGLYVGRFNGSRGDLIPDDDLAIGIHLEPGMLVTIMASRSLNVVAGATLPVFILFLLDAGENELFFPILPYAGVELGLADDLNLFALLRFGPALHIVEAQSESELELMLRLLLGIEYLL